MAQSSGRYARSGEAPPPLIQAPGGSARASQRDLLEIPVDLTGTKLGYGADGKFTGLLVFRVGNLVETAAVIDDTARQCPDLGGLVNTPDTDVINARHQIFIKHAPDKPARTASIGCYRHPVHLGAKMVYPDGQ